ncbi:hypothetical protein QE152_g8143 [Popillia japonica]|uniref:Uncharacterized protein n=1 Tax=Popillia japonica TaxID=7064 RepID=A0AAW1M5K0_POPJA
MKTHTSTHLNVNVKVVRRKSSITVEWNKLSTIFGEVYRIEGILETEISHHSVVFTSRPQCVHRGDLSSLLSDILVRKMIFVR